METRFVYKICDARLKVMNADDAERRLSLSHVSNLDDTRADGTGSENAKCCLRSVHKSYSGDAWPKRLYTNGTRRHLILIHVSNSNDTFRKDVDSDHERLHLKL